MVARSPGFPLLVASNHVELRSRIVHRAWRRAGCRNRLSSVLAAAHCQRGGLYRASPVGRKFRVAGDANGPDDARRGGTCRSRRLLHSGCRQPLRRLGHTGRIRRRNGRIGSGHDRPAADGEMERGRYCRGRRRWPHARHHRNAQGEIHRLDGRRRQSGHRNRELGGALLVSLLALAAPLAAIAVVILFLWLAIRLLRQLLEQRTGRKRKK